jgi:hypothetical protein
MLETTAESLIEASSSSFPPGPRSGHPHAHRHRVLADVQSGDPVHHHVHAVHLHRGSDGRAGRRGRACRPQGPLRMDTGPRARWQQSDAPEDPRHTRCAGSDHSTRVQRRRRATPRQGRPDCHHQRPRSRPPILRPRHRPSKNAKRLLVLNDTDHRAAARARPKGALTPHQARFQRDPGRAPPCSRCARTGRSVPSGSDLSQWIQVHALYGSNPAHPTVAALTLICELYPQHQRGLPRV